MAISRLTDLGFAEFIASLLSETFESLVASEAKQLERYEELLASAEMDDETFTALHVTDADVELGLFGLAPGEDGKHAVVAGAPLTEAIKGQFGSELKPNHTRKRQGRLRLTRAGANFLTTAVAMRIGAARQRAVRAAVRRGVPQLQVEGGDINSSLEFNVLVDSDEDDRSDAAASARSSRPATATVASNEQPPPTISATRISALAPRNTNGALSTSLASDNPLLASAVSDSLRETELSDALKRRALNPAVIASAVDKVRLSVTPTNSQVTDKSDDQEGAQVLGSVNIRFRTREV